MLLVMCRQATRGIGKDKGQNEKSSRVNTSSYQHTTIGQRAGPDHV